MRLFTIIVVLALSSTALAESSIPSCTPGRLSPTGNRVPANLPAFLLEAGIFHGDPVISLFQRIGSDDVERSITVERDARDPLRWFLVPAMPLEEGGAYVILDTTCVDEISESTYFVDPAATLPTILGITTVSELRAVRRSPGELLQYYVQIGFVPSAEALAARSLYEVQLRVDGASIDERWEELGELGQRRYVACDGPTGASLIAPGTRSLAHHARLLRSADPSLSTEPVVRELRCEEAIRWNEAEDRRATPAEIDEMDRLGTPMRADAGDGLDGGIEPGTRATGCGCRLSPSGASTSWLPLLALLLHARRRRRLEGPFAFGHGARLDASAPSRGLVVGYGFAFAGHWIIERDRPLTFENPIRAGIANWVMFFMQSFSDIEGHLERLAKDPPATDDMGDQ